MTQTPANKRHLLTVLVEDYFHVGAFGNLIQQRNWTNFEPRYEQNTLKTLDLLDQYDAKATFFVLGWIGEQNPKLVREIVARGHEVASRGFYHRSLKNLTNEEFREDLRKTNRILEDASGQKIIGYRSAEKLNYEKDSWIFDALAEEGFVYDASFLPSQKDEKAKRFAHKVHTSGKAVWEFPYSTRNLGLGLLPISGGNYFRQFPYTLMRKAVKDWANRYEEPFLFYFHVWELDPEQPRISAASSYNRIRHYRKLDKMEWILRENLSLYNFTGAADYLGLKSELRISNYEMRDDKSVLEIQTPKTKDQKPVSVVIPCYNEEPTLPYLANTLRSVEENLSQSGFQPEFIFIDDCSKDNTLAKLKELFGQKENVRIVPHETNKGVAAGIMTGLLESKTEIVCSMDCDCTYDPHELVRMLPLLTESVDLVTASPYHALGSVRNVPGWRLFLSKGASFLYRRALHSKLDTYTSCFRVYRRSSVINLPIEEKGFLGVAEMLGRLDLQGGKIVEFPAVLEVRLFGFSKMKTARTIFGHLKLLSKLSKLRFFRKPAEIRTSLPKENLKIISKER
ncbi:MAG: arnC 7 [Acidobacteria bacterium]|jgi:polysaccharide deacetylase family protein (PEP-CTERM system associated)|nr:arnC 7 [Acidobacteriota bacterium]